MAWKGVHLTRPSRLSLASNQLRVDQEDGETTIPLEDIAWIVADDHKTTLTVSLLAACAEHGVAVIVSDDRHMPAALTLPFHSHRRTAAVARMQIDATVPVRKRTWQTIVRQKIINQSIALSRAGFSDGPPLCEMAARVRSGDPDNIEAQAARAYWKALFDGFVRNERMDLRNKALNYAYAVLRACIARALTAAGFLPSIGIHHCSMTNPFNLADDLMEPFRPVADLVVLELTLDRAPGDQLTREDRQILSGLPRHDTGMNGETVSVLHATEMAAQSLVRVLENKDASMLVLPDIPSIQRALPGLSG